MTHDQQGRDLSVGASNPAPISLLVISNMWPSDAAPAFGSFVARQVDALRRAGAEVTVVANSENRRGPVRAALKYASLSRRARRAARGGRFDAVIGHYLYPTAVFARDAARTARAPLVLVAHGTDARSIMRGDRWARRSWEALLEARMVVAVSDALKDKLRKTVGVPESIRVEVVNMGFDETTFVPDPSARALLGVSESERVMLFVGNLEPVKGVDLALEAFAILASSGDVDRFVIVGAGTLERTLLDRVEDLGRRAGRGVSDRVLLTGALDHSRVAKWMAAADIVVLPSRNEGLGTVLLEAMATGTPCVAARVGGIPEILDDSCGRLVPPEDVEALAQGVRDVLTSGRGEFEEACITRASRHTGSVKAAEFLDRLMMIPEVQAGRRGVV